MSLKKKIALSFFISAFIIAMLAAFEYLSFIEIRKEIRFLEITDTISRKSVQLRRHEKNFLLYSPQKADIESATVYAYISELQYLLAVNPGIDRTENQLLRKSVTEYERLFRKIAASAEELTSSFDKQTSLRRRNSAFFSLAQATFLERPSQTSDALMKAYGLPADHGLVVALRKLDVDISALRKTGEDILVVSKDLDKTAREKTELVIRVSQIAILVFFPLFFAAGIGMLFFITASVVRRLKLLIAVVEKTGKGSYPHLDVPLQEGAAPDEVGVLIDKFNTMEDELSRHAEELDRKNKELIQTRKLAAIGTLAAGVAHELNNPLSNIYLSSQMLAKSPAASGSPEVREAVSDIMSQSVRVKRIVADLLEFARGREPRMQSVDLADLINRVYRKLTVDTAKVRFSLASDGPAAEINADPDQLEQVFINLFTNAVEAMPDGGDLRVEVSLADDVAHVTVSDTGRGMRKESLDKVFEPFFTTKDRGTGLGLAIVFNIVRKHYGEIKAASAEGGGTTFTITLPRAL